MKLFYSILQGRSHLGNHDESSLEVFWLTFDTFWHLIRVGAVQYFNLVMGTESVQCRILHPQ